MNDEGLQKVFNCTTPEKKKNCELPCLKILQRSIKLSRYLIRQSNRTF